MDLSDFAPDDIPRAREHVLRGSYDALELDFVIGDLSGGVRVLPVERWPVVRHSAVADYLDQFLSWGEIQDAIEQVSALRARRIDHFQLQLNTEGVWVFPEGVVGFVSRASAGPPKAVHSLDAFEKALDDLAEAQVRHYSIALERRNSVSPDLVIRREDGRRVVREAEGGIALARVIQDLIDGNQHLIEGFVARVEGVMRGQRPHNVLWFSDSEIFVYPDGAVVPGEPRGGVRVLQLDELIKAIELAKAGS